MFIRLEVHLSIEWQHVLCDSLATHLGNKLYRPETDPVDWTKPENVPTPKKFQGKVILVGNRFEPTRKREEPIERNSGNGRKCEEDEEIAMVTEEDESCDVLTGKPKKERRLELCQRLSSLIAPFMESKHLRDVVQGNKCMEYYYNHIIMGNPPSARAYLVSSKRHVLSMCESTGLRIVHNQFATFNNLYRSFLLRVTPNLARVDSSNLNPQEYAYLSLKNHVVTASGSGIMGLIWSR